MSSIKKFFLLIILLANCVLVRDSFAQRSTKVDDAPASAGSPTPFADVVKKYFDQWDNNGDGTLSKNEIEAAVANTKFHDETAAGSHPGSRHISSKTLKGLHTSPL
jgi:hypothetical protein